jgi:hypothetical protein
MSLRRRDGVFLLIALSGCLATRSEIGGAFRGDSRASPNAPRVSALFVFRHETQRHGFDSISKLQFTGVTDFENLFRDALSEIGNLSRYETFTELPSDVDNPKRREELEAKRASLDYTVAIDFLEESSFRREALMGTISLLSLTAIPVPFEWNYTISTTITRKDGSRVAQYRRQATLSNWVEGLLIFAYPFYPLQGKREEIYSESLHDTFRQIEAEKVLAP